MSESPSDNHRGHAAQERDPSHDGPRTRGGWRPVGTGAQRRAGVGVKSTPKAARTRQRLLDSARAVFERVGYFDATVDEIVAGAGLARGSFYTYFPDKLTLFQVLAQEVTDSIARAVLLPESDRTLSRHDRLDAANRRYIEAYRENAALYGLVEQLATMDETIRDGRHQSRRDNVERVATNIRRWQHAGVADPDIDAETTAGLLVAMTSNFCYWWFVGGEPYDEDLAATHLTRAWAQAIGLTDA